MLAGCMKNAAEICHNEPLLIRWQLAVGFVWWRHAFRAATVCMYHGCTLRTGTIYTGRRERSTAPRICAWIQAGCRAALICAAKAAPVAGSEVTARWLPSAQPPRTSRGDSPRCNTLCGRQAGSRRSPACRGRMPIRQAPRSGIRSSAGDGEEVDTLSRATA